jgi:hypothetical protein
MFSYNTDPTPHLISIYNLIGTGEMFSRLLKN